MRAGHDQLVDAWLILEQEEAGRDRLIRAATVFWSATYFLDRWPSELQAHAQQVQQTLLAQGKIPQTVAEMSEAEVTQASEQLRLFLQAALRPDAEQDA